MEKDDTLPPDPDIVDLMFSLPRLFIWSIFVISTNLLAYFHIWSSWLSIVNTSTTGALETITSFRSLPCIPAWSGQYIHTRTFKWELMLGTRTLNITTVDFTQHELRISHWFSYINIKQCRRKCGIFKDNNFEKNMFPLLCSEGDAANGSMS